MFASCVQMIANCIRALNLKDFRSVIMCKGGRVCIGCASVSLKAYFVLLLCSLHRCTCNS